MNTAGTDENLIRLMPMPGYGAFNTTSGASARAEAGCPNLCSGTNKRLCSDSCPSKRLHKYCFQFLLGLKTNLKLCLWKILEGQKRNYGKFKNYLYGEFESGLLACQHCFYVTRVIAA